MPFQFVKKNILLVAINNCDLEYQQERKELKNSVKARQI